MKEEKVWWIKIKLNNFKKFYKLKLNNQINLTIKWISFLEKVKKMMNKLDF
jgi:hypothetical protein